MRVLIFFRLNMISFCSFIAGLSKISKKFSRIPGTWDINLIKTMVPRLFHRIVVVKYIRKADLWKEKQMACRGRFHRTAVITKSRKYFFNLYDPIRSRSFIFVIFTKLCFVNIPLFFTNTLTAVDFFARD